MIPHFLQALLMDCVSAGQNGYIVPWFKQILEEQPARTVLLTRDVHAYSGEVEQNWQ